VRQFFSPRFWFTLLALAAITLAATSVFRHTSSAGDNASSVPSTSSTPGAPGTTVAGAPSDVPARTVDLVSLVYLASPAKGFGFRNGVTTADLALTLDGTRTMVVKKGTEGDNHCKHLTKVASCVVAASLLGDGVRWFSLTDGAPGSTAQLPGIVHLVDTKWVQLANGWVVQRAPLVTRSCADDTTSLLDFVTTFGTKSKSTFNLTNQRIEKVTCTK
jgi:hypothetical protein